MNTWPSNDDELRDYFAAYALQGLLANGYLDQSVEAKTDAVPTWEERRKVLPEAECETCALAYRLADRMLETMRSREP